MSGAGVVAGRRRLVRIERSNRGPVMSPNLPPEQLARMIPELNRDQCIAELQRFDRFPIDFTPQYLQQLSIDKLRHILLAAFLTAGSR